MRKKYKDIIKNIDDPNIILPIKKTTRWQPQTGLYYPLENPIVAAKNRLPIKYIFPGKPIRYGAYNTPYISILDQPMILESGAFTTTEGIVKVKRKPKITDLGKLFRENEKKLTQESKDQGYKETGQAGQEQETIQLLKTEQAQKTKTKILLQQQQQAQKQGQQTVSIFSPEYKVTAIGQKQYVMPSKVSKMYIPAAIKTAFDVQTKTAQAQKQKIDSLMATDLLSAQKQTQGLLSQSATLSLQSDATAQTTAQKQSSMQKQQQDTTMFYKTPLTNTMTPLWDLSIIKPTKNKQTKTKRISHGIPESEPETPTKQKSVNGKGYHVYVKKRHIVSGKTTGNKGYEQISRNPLNKKDALRLGANIVDTTPRATFLIKPTNKAAQPLRQNIPSWETQRKKFYKKNNRYIEKTKHRIDSPGELQGITVKGLEALDRQITSDLKQYRRRTRRLI